MSDRAAPPGASALVHGAAWRAASLAARVAFLALVVPKTLPGEFGVFFSYSSIGLLLGRVVSLGAIDHLPTVIKGDSEAMRRACRDFSPMFLLASAAILGAAVLRSVPLSAVAVALSMSSGLMLAGAVRSVSPASFERWMNLHPLFFLAMAVVMGSALDAAELLVLQAVSIAASQLLLLCFAIGPAGIPADASPAHWPARVRGLLAGGQSRMLSDALIAACLRSIAMGPVLLGIGAIGDSLALALALGEAMWMVGMILVHRNFSFYCSVGPDSLHSVRSASLLFAVVSAAGIAGVGLVFALGEVEILRRIEPSMLLAAFCFFAGVTALSEFRYFDLAAGHTLSVWIAAQAIFVILAAIAPGVLGELAAIWCIALAAVFPAVVMTGLRWRAARRGA